MLGKGITWSQVQTATGCLRATITKVPAEGGKTETREEAVLILRKTLGIKQGEKGATRTASEGSIFARVSDNKRIGAIIELNSETDFVARNNDFRTIGKSLVDNLKSMLNKPKPRGWIVSGAKPRPSSSTLTSMTP